MLEYKKYEQAVYEWLSSKQLDDNSFTFSLRQNSAKGAEKDYFIGTENSGYFGTTFWYLPVSFPGSSGDCIALLFNIGKNGYSYSFEFTQTTSPDSEQNASALRLIQLLKAPLLQNPGLQRESPDGNKMFTLRTKPKQKYYDEIGAMLSDIDKELPIIISLVDNNIALEKLNNPSFKAHRITSDEFKNIKNKMEVRQSKVTTLVARKNIRYWLYSPGEQAFLWDEFYSKSIMALGWDNLGDISKYSSKEEIEKALQRLGNTTDSKKNNAVANYEFANGMAIGDCVIVKKGRRELLGYGIVTSDHYYDDASDEYHNTRKVDWKKKGHWQTGFDLVLKTLTDITSYEEQSGSKKDFYYQRLLEIMEDKAQPAQLYSAPINQILYGPPGTGKTYNTVLEAAKIVTENNSLTFAEALPIFNAHLKDQIEFITFHQNFSYEDFIQGLRPDTENGSALTFEKKDGIFKRIADKALKNLEASENPAGAKKEFDIVFRELIQPLNDGDVEEVEIKMKKSSYFITEVGEKSIAFRKSIGDSEHTLSINTLRKMYDNGMNDIIAGGLQPYYNPILEMLLEMGKSTATAVIKKNFVIIIDEINRANISRVFGELITLIEEDKRSRGKIPMSVTLPSGDNFIVPSNLYIIGTMNTADKSIALLDIALRRRFEFVPMYPQYEIEGQTIHHREVLKIINDKICKLKTRDFQIGHAYFMESENIEHIMNRKVIPLLLEYFMNDEKTVKEIITIPGYSVDTDQWPMKFSQN